MSTYVIGDIHGGFKALKQLITQINPTQRDQLVFLGDFVDGWSQPVETIEYAISLSEQLNCVFIRGNHDDLTQQWMEKNTDNPMWLLSGGLSTVNAYNAVDSSVFNKHLKFFKQLKNFHIDAENRLFVHAGFHNLKGVEHEYHNSAFYWDRTLWETACALDPSIDENSVFYPKRFKIYHNIFIGHTPTTRIGSDVPVKKANVYNIDTGAGFKGKLTALRLDDEAIFQSDEVFRLYPNERGRN